MRIRTIALIIVISISTGIAQNPFNKNEFLQRTRTIYHSLQSGGLNNFACWITSDYFLEATKEISEDEIYPLELIWKSPNLFYYIRRALPPVEDEEKIPEINELQLNMIQALKGLLIDWQRFCAGNILDDLADIYSIYTVKDTAYVEYENIEDDQSIKVKMTFGLNGICLKLSVVFSAKGEIVNTYPSYRLIGDKWLCTGWTVQTLKDNYVESGFVVKLRSTQLNNYWIPERLNLQLQKKGSEEIIYTRTYIFKNIVLNKPLTFTK